MAQYIITLGRQHGCGGRQIGREAAKRLGIAYYDKEIIKGLIAEDCGLTKEAVDEFIEKRTSSLLYEMAVFSSMGPLEEKVFISQNKIVKELADKSSCIFVGACADYILRDRDNLLRIFLIGDIKQRLARVRAQSKETAAVTERELKTADRKRASYYTFFTTKKWGEKKNYDLLINVKLGEEFVTELIADAAEKYFGGR